MNRRRLAAGGLRLSLLVACAVGLLPSPSLAQAPLVTGLGGPLDFGTSTLARDDDDVGLLVDLMPAFPMGLDFFGTRYTSLYVNTNGNFSFGAPLSNYTPEEFPSSSRPVIAAWWADVDTRAVPADPDRNLVYYALSPGRLVATWIDVGYFRTHTDLLNAFQIILTAAPGEPAGTFDVEFRYNRCEWTTGDDTPGGIGGLGGIAAQAGLDGGDMVNYVTLPGSRTMDVVALCTTSNVDMTGVWRLHPRGAAVAAMCGNGLRETGETCDDGGRAPHDGCDENCQIDTPCIQIYSDGAIIYPFDSQFLFEDVGDVSFPDALGGDALGGDALGGLVEMEVGEFDTGPPLRPCSELPDPMDAGMMAPRDGATGFDGGTPMDTGPVPNVLTVTGSGCSCRVGARRARSGWGVVLVALGLIARRRRAPRG